MSNGYFIDLAANQWKKGSNTYVLEYFNKWKGVCIEANPSYHENLVANRKCLLFVNPVSSAIGEKATFHLKGVYSGILGKEFDNNHESVKQEEVVGRKAVDIEVETVTLTSILDFAKAPAIIHYLSLDIEGAEYHAMKGFDFTRYTIYMITIERPKAKLHYLLVKNGYLFANVLTIYGECLYFHHSIPNLKRLWAKYHQDGGKGIWEGERHEYFFSLKWEWNITDYLLKASAEYNLHHHSSKISEHVAGNGALHE